VVTIASRRAELLVFENRAKNVLQSAVVAQADMRSMSNNRRTYSLVTNIQEIRAT
jgi:hypothetical protein